jgi:threonine dehydrogenase-like Zn-dependent dehydrogenase
VRGDDVRIRVLKTSICGTDVHIYNWDAWAQKTIPVPMTIGHEFVGVVDDVGDHVKGFAKGDLLVGDGHITCGHCRNCLAGRRHLCPNTQGVGVNCPGAWGNSWRFHKTTAGTLMRSKHALDHLEEKRATQGEPSAWKRAPMRPPPQRVTVTGNTDITRDSP